MNKSYIDLLCEHCKVTVREANKAYMSSYRRKVTPSRPVRLQNKELKERKVTENSPVRLQEEAIAPKPIYQWKPTKHKPCKAVNCPICPHTKG